MPASKFKPHVIGYCPNPTEIRRRGFQCGPWSPDHHGYAMYRPGCFPKLGRKPKLDAAQRAKVRALYLEWQRRQKVADELRPTEIARMYNVSLGLISTVIREPGPVAELDVKEQAAR